jgi:UDP-N-acetylmuramyl pentapeptide phosphotransferase/UDP-N-acetylglucosamine-1-phosphate transferase
VTTFYAVCAGAAATLVGLLFVAVQIGPPLVRSGPVGRRHAMARSTFAVFATIFGLSLYLLVPNQPSRTRAIVAIAVCALGVVRSIRTWIPVWRDKLQGRIEFRLWQTAWLLIGPVLAYADLAKAAVTELGSPHTHVLDTAARLVFIVLFAVALRNSWNLLVEATAA